MVILYNIINPLVGLWIFLLMVSVIASWLIAFGVVNPRNQIVATILQVSYGLTEPVLRPIRRVIPSIGGIDISPIIALVGIRALQSGLNHYLFLPAINAGL
ncbi:MAG: YggT family protein [Parvularcula sp.]